MTAVSDPTEFDRRAAESNALLIEANRTCDPEAIDRAIASLSALEADLRPNVHPGVSTNLAHLLIARFEVRGDAARDDLDQGIASLDRLIRVGDQSGDHHRAQLGFLARGLRTRYQTRGDPRDLDTALTYLRQLVSIPESRAERADALVDLADMLVLRWGGFHQESDLSEALGYFSDARPLTDDPLHVARLENHWGIACFELSKLRPDLPNQLQESARHLEAAVAAYPAGHPGRIDPQNNLAGVLVYRANLLRKDRPTEAAEDFDHAVGVMRDLIAANALTQVMRAKLEHNLATMLIDRDAAGDLEEAASLIAQARTEPDNEGENKARFASAQGLVELRLYERTHLDVHADRSAAAYGEAALDQQDPETALAAARFLGGLEAMRGRWPAAAAAYRRAADVVERMYRGLASRTAKQNWLSHVTGLPESAAVAFVRAGDAAGAVEILERTRTMIVAERVSRRDARLETLRAAGHETLAARYEAAVAAWDEAPPGSASEITAEAGVDAAIDEIRGVEGFEDFLRTNIQEALHELAQQRPIVFVAVGDHGGVALVADGDDVTAVPLPALDRGNELVLEALMYYGMRYDDRGAHPDDWRTALDVLTGWIGEAIMAPVLERLRGASECTLIPTGALALLPLHAAWTKAAGRRTYTLDVVAVSYAVSLRALAAARAPAKDTQRMLAIEDPQPVKADPLPAAAREVAAVTGHFASVNRLAGPAATLTAVMEGLADSDCIYFACHGAVDETNPVDSYVLLADDERLTLGAITRGGRLGAGLVVFSACESAIAGMTAIDEVLNLPSALLERGAGAAIGSLWIANDGATALLMARIFWNWREGGMDLPAAMRDAQQWVRDATNGQMVEWLTSTAPTNEGHRRLSLRRAGLPPDERPFPHVADWGAFVYFGR